MHGSNCLRWVRGEGKCQACFWVVTCGSVFKVRAGSTLYVSCTVRNHVSVGCNSYYLVLLRGTCVSAYTSGQCQPLLALYYPLMLLKYCWPVPRHFNRRDRAGKRHAKGSLEELADCQLLNVPPHDFAARWALAAKSRSGPSLFGRTPKTEMTWPVLQMARAFSVSWVGQGKGTFRNGPLVVPPGIF